MGALLIGFCWANLTAGRWKLKGRSRAPKTLLQEMWIIGGKLVAKEWCPLKMSIVQSRSASLAGKGFKTRWSMHSRILAE